MTPITATLDIESSGSNGDFLLIVTKLLLLIYHSSVFMYRFTATFSSLRSWYVQETLVFGFSFRHEV